MERTELAARIHEVSHLTGHFVLRSGQTSGQYSGIQENPG